MLLIQHHHHEEYDDVDTSRSHTVDSERVGVEELIA